MSKGTMQFIGCNDDECPLNQDRQCRAPWIAVDSDGNCITRSKGPFDNKSETERYVELSSCSCTSCVLWEREDDDSDEGRCGAGKDLHFVPRDAGVKCLEFEKQIDEPDPFSTTMP